MFERIDVIALLIIDLEKKNTGNHSKWNCSRFIGSELEDLIKIGLRELELIRLAE